MWCLLREERGSVKDFMKSGEHWGSLPWLQWTVGKGAEEKGNRSHEWISGIE